VRGFNFIQLTEDSVAVPILLERLLLELAMAAGF